MLIGSLIHFGEVDNDDYELHEIVEKTIKEHSKEIAENVMKHNALVNKK